MSENQPIIKKVRKGAEAAPHGGAWKVAYADFVTAMMAFFLLLWLLNATTEAQRQGIADYFAPASISRTNSGAGGILGGTSSSTGNRASDSVPSGVLLTLPPDFSEADVEGEPSGDKESEDEKLAGMSAEEIDKRMTEVEDAQFEAIERELREAVESSEEMKQMAENLIVDRIPEGIRIQIVDHDKVSMFPSGGAEMYDHTRELLAHVSRIIVKMPQKVAIAGHTDAVPFTSENGYSNWELSTDRANASRRVLLESGIDPTRITRVVGRAETDPLLPDDPTNPRNRRISIVLLRDQSMILANGGVDNAEEIQQSVEDAFRPIIDGGIIIEPEAVE